MKFAIIAITLLYLSSSVLNLSRSQGFWDSLTGGSGEFKSAIKKWCGKETAKLTNTKPAKTNGCGPEFLEKIKLNEATKALGDSVNQCCNTHDVCYGECVKNASGDAFRAAKVACDKAMRTCVDGVAGSGEKGAKRAAVFNKLLYNAVKSAFTKISL